jgi:hypothetical protein
MSDAELIAALKAAARAAVQHDKPALGNLLYEAAFRLEEYNASHTDHVS